VLKGIDNFAVAHKYGFIGDDAPFVDIGPTCPLKDPIPLKLRELFGHVLFGSIAKLNLELNCPLVLVKDFVGKLP